MRVVFAALDVRRMFARQVREHLADLPLRLTDCWSAPALYGALTIRIMHTSLLRRSGSPTLVPSSRQLCGLGV